MARCGCAQGCSCAVEGAPSQSAATSVVGNGAPGSPYVIESEAILVPDGTGPIFGENALKVSASGLYVDATRITANYQAGVGYQLVASDAGKIIECDNALPFSLVIPLNAAVAFPIGTLVEIYQMGVGQVTVSFASDLRAPNGASTALRDSIITLWKRDIDVWVLAGDAA